MGILHTLIQDVIMLRWSRGIFWSLALVGFAVQLQAAEEKLEISPTVLYQATDVLTSYLQKDMTKVSNVTKKVVVVNYTQSETLPPSLKAYVLKKIEQISTKNPETPVRILQCMECLSVKAEAQGDEIFIKKGVNNKAELEQILTKMNVRNYADLNITYAGRFLVLQMSILDKDGVVEWADEYKTPIGAYNDSQWILGFDVEGVAFLNSKFPSPKGGRVYVGQRLFGLGAVGISGATIQKTDSLAAINTYAGFFELSHNELFKAYWEFIELNYVFELGITDFNSKQQLAESFGVKAKFGQYFTLRLAGTANQFLKKPADDTEIYNPKGESFIKNNEPLPARITIGIGVEI